MKESRFESDILGSIAVPADRYWGAQTQRALENFAIGGGRMPVEVIRALAMVKLAAARVNGLQGKLPADLGGAIEKAAGEVMRGELDDHFPLGVWQTGSGTQTHMNVNEVIGNRASELLAGRFGDKSPVHPNDHVNRSQSSNDTFPTAMHIAAVMVAREKCLPGLNRLLNALRAKSRELEGIVKTGRTHCMDATPLTLGQVFGGYETQVSQGIERLEVALEGIFELAQGGTAVGTGLNTEEGFDRLMASEIAMITGEPFVSAKNKFAAQAAHDALVTFSGALRGVAVALFKIANDIRLLASGPRCGLGELVLPVNEPGSSIMPGKVNPTQCEAVIQICAQVMGNDGAIGFAGTQGPFELNTCKPVIICNLLESLRLIGGGSAGFARHCVEGIKPDGVKIAEYLDRSLMLVTALAPEIGYDAAAKIAGEALRKGTTLREEALRDGMVSAEEFDRLVIPETMTRPGPSAAENNYPF